MDVALHAVRLQEALEFVAAEEIARARAEDGATWEDVGRAFGVTAQSAHSRFGRKRQPSI